MPSHTAPTPHAPKGMTLVEALVAIAILVVVATTVTASLAIELRARGRALAAASAAMDAGNGVRAIREHLAGAMAILPTATIGGIPVTTGPDAIAFEVPTVDTTGTVRATRDRIAVARADGAPQRLELRVDPATGSRLPAGTRTIARHVTAFRIRYAAVTPTAARLTHVILQSTDGIGAFTATVTQGAVIRLENIP